MRRFATLYQQLDGSTATGDKVASLRAYFAAAPAEDAAWAVYFLAGGKPRQVVPTALLRELACRLAGIEAWLFEECYQAVGDLAETITNVLPQELPLDALAPSPALPEGEHDNPGRADAGRADGLAHWVEERLLPLRGLAPAEQAARLSAAFAQLDRGSRFLLVKLIGGGFRVGVSKLLVQRALAEVAGIDAKLVAERMMGYADARAAPSAARYAALIAPVAPPVPSAPASTSAASAWSSSPEASAALPVREPSGQPYPFFLAHALEAEPASLGAIGDWLVEWKYDGIRAQLVKRGGRTWIWSRGEELIGERFPEITQAASALPDGTVLDGELLAWHDGAPAPASFHLLQQRIGRKTQTKKVLAEAPVRFLAYDLLESDGGDRRGEPQQRRRERLEVMFAARAGTTGASTPGPTPGHTLDMSPLLHPADWAEAAAWRAGARERGVEGLMLKQRQARYGSGRTKSEGTWWKWKVEPLAVDAVLVYAQAGHGRRASVYTDYTFAVWSRPPRGAAEAAAVVEAIARGEPAPRADSDALQLLPFAKAYSGLSDEEFRAVDREIRAHTLEKFGPVRSVRPTLVFEIGFEGIGASPRHKSGVAVRFPRMLRIRNDKPLHEADSIDTLRALLDAAGPRRA